jgi:hypothetical protein
MALAPDPRCKHLISHIDEVAHRFYCQQCGASGEHQETVYGSHEFDTSDFRYEYCPVKTFMTYVGLIEDQYCGSVVLPNPQPLMYGHMKMLEAHKHCKFEGKNLAFTKPFILYKLSQIISETIPEFKAWTDVIWDSGRIPSGDNLRRQECRWTEIEKHIHPDWKLKNRSHKPILGSAVCRQLK